MTMIIMAFLSLSVAAQDLDEILSSLAEDEKPIYALATFKGTTIINGQSVEVPGAGDLYFKISHRFSVC